MAAAEVLVEKKTKLPPHHIKGGFTNPWPSFEMRGFIDFFSAFPKMEKVLLPPKVEPFTVTKPDWEKVLNPDKKVVQATWIGHASFLIQMDGLNILTDPLFSNCCGPYSMLGPQRYTRVPFDVKELPQIDVAIISHNHYDHLDTGSVNQLRSKVKHWYVPLGVKAWFTSSGVLNVTELDWWESSVYVSKEKGAELNVVCTPCQHFSGRSLTDRNSTLWASWSLLSKSGRFYFAGDTGYKTVPRSENGETVDESKLPTCPAFKEIGEKYGPFDLACIPIGAYSPRWFMSAVHLNPEDAVAVHREVKSKQSIGMHFGTFKLTDEPIHDPPAKLSKSLEAAGLKQEEFIILQHGETRSYALKVEEKEKKEEKDEVKEEKTEKDAAITASAEVETKEKEQEKEKEKGTSSDTSVGEPPAVGILPTLVASAAVKESQSQA